MDELKQKLQEELEGKNGGVSAAIYHNGSTEFYSYGTDNPDESSLYEIGSITKVFTALLFLILEGKGQIYRHDPIKKYLPGINLQDSKVAYIKLEQLVLHSSGLPRLPSNMPVANPENPYADYTRSHLYDFLSGYELNHESIGAFEYSNLGYGLLGHILERAVSKAYANLAKEKIFKPLGMHSSFVNTDEEHDATLRPGHNEEGKAVSNWYLGALPGAGGIVSTAYDMSLFLETQINPPGDTLGQCIEISQKPVISSSDRRRHAFGWAVNALESGSDLIWHNGQTGGYQSLIGFVPEENYGAVVLANCKLDLDKIIAETFGVA